jgi:hypothetical protein
MLSGIVAFMPLEIDGLNRIPDVFADAIKPN